MLFGYNMLYKFVSFLIYLCSVFLYSQAILGSVCSLSNLYVVSCYCTLLLFVYFYFTLTFYSLVVFLDGGPQPEMTRDKLPRMPIRRNLSVLLPSPSPQAMARSQMFEDPLPLQYTPEPVRKTTPPLSCSSNVDLNMTFEVNDKDDRTASNATIAIHCGSPSQESKFPGLSQKMNTPEATRGHRFPYKR